MRNLIRAEIYRCKHDILFFFMLLVCVATGIFNALICICDIHPYGPDSILLYCDIFVMPLYLIQAVYISFNVGREYRDGTIRNKIITGKTKLVIVLTRLLVNMVISVIITGLFFIPYIMITYEVELCKIPIPFLMNVLLGIFLVNIIWSIIFTFVSSMISIKEVSGIVNCTLIIAIRFISFLIESLFFQTRTSSSILIKIDSFLPGGQIYKYMRVLTSYQSYYHMLKNWPSRETVEYYKIDGFPLHSLFLIIVLSAVAMLIFRKKDVK